LRAICSYVDDPNSKGASVFDTTYVLYRGASQALVEAKDACSSSETCSSATNLVQTAKEGLSSSVSSVWSYFSDSLGRTIESISNKTEILMLESEVDILRKQIEDLKKNSYTGLIMEQVRGYPWSHGILNSLSGGTLEEILTLEKRMGDTEARILKMKQNNF